MSVYGHRNSIGLQEVLNWMQDGFNGMLLAFGGAVGIRRAALFGGEGGLLLQTILRDLRGRGGGLGN